MNYNDTWSQPAALLLMLQNFFCIYELTHLIGLCHFDRQGREIMQCFPLKAHSQFCSLGSRCCSIFLILEFWSHNVGVMLFCCTTWDASINVFFMRFFILDWPSCQYTYTIEWNKAGLNWAYSPLIWSPLIANAEMLVDRVFHIPIKTLAFTCKLIWSVYLRSNA